jgi:hypothetical protein
MVRVVFIGGYGRSGSTLLDTMLGVHDDVFGGGELEMLFKDLAAGGCCTCGRPYDDCPVWGEVLADVADRRVGLDPTQLAERLARAESTLGRYRFGDRKALLARHGDVWGALFRSLAEVTGRSVVVDSSKSSRGSSRRITALARHAGLEVRVIHLIRDPRAVVYSERNRGNNDRLEANETSTRSPGGALRFLVGWSMANLAVTLSALTLPSLRVLRVHYEHLVTEPESTLATIGRFIGLDLAPVADRIRAGTAFDPGHGVRGNRMRREGPIVVRHDTEWITAGPTGPRWLSLAFAPLARLYGYDLMRWPRPPTDPQAGPIP